MELRKKVSFDFESFAVRLASQLGKEKIPFVPEKFNLVNIE